MPVTLSTQSRQDESGRAYAGSQRQIQTLVNQHPQLLNQAISQAFQRPMPLRWVSPLQQDKFQEYRDSQFLDALGLSAHRKALSHFWPNRGPQWDALACIDDGSEGIVLVEAKSHLPEIYGSGCTATAPASIRKIDASLAITRDWLHANSSEDWKGPLYQTANRLAHLYFFREVLGVQAWLVNACFLDDPHSPTSRAEWNLGLPLVKLALGIDAFPWCADVFLPAMG